MKHQTGKKDDGRKKSQSIFEVILHPSRCSRYITSSGNVNETAMSTDLLRFICSRSYGFE